MKIYNNEYVAIIEEILERLLKAEDIAQEKLKSRNDLQGELPLETEDL